MATSAQLEGMKHGACTIHTLDLDCLGRIFGKLDDDTRRKVVPFVCKAWREVEATSFQPLHLRLKVRDIQLPKLLWFLRDTRRLRAVAMQPHSGWFEFYSTRNCLKFWKAMRLLLDHLTVAAPALSCLELFLDVQPDGEERHNSLCPPSFLPLLGRMTQLRSLTLVEWTCTEGQIPLLCHLGRLTNLQDLILHGLDVPGVPEAWDFEPAPFVDEVSSELSKAIASLPRLTSLHLRGVWNVEVLPEYYADNLTNLRDLILDNNDLSPVVAEMTRLTRLTFAMRKIVYPRPMSAGVEQLFSKLSSLKELAVDMLLSDNSERHLLATSEAAELTCVTLHGIQGKHCQHWHELLCSSRLRTLSNLTLAFNLYSTDRGKDESEVRTSWPAPWSKLTSLALQCYTSAASNQRHFYFPCLTGFWKFASMQSIRQLDITVSSFIFTKSDCDLDALLHVSEFLIGSRLMLINIVLPREEARDQAIKILKESCTRLCARVPGLQFSIGAAHESPYRIGRIDQGGLALVTVKRA